jgi:hypothetical protein
MGSRRVPTGGAIWEEKGKYEVKNVPEKASEKGAQIPVISGVLRLISQGRGA